MLIFNKNNTCSFLKFFLFIFSLTISFFLHAEKYVFNMISLGDSISTGFNAGSFGNNKKYSWATGYDGENVKSHLWHLRELFLEKEIYAQNLAIPGSQSNKLKKQLEKIKDLKVDYATIMVGSNDICNWKKDYQKEITHFKNNLKDTVDILIEQSPEIKILMLPIPDLYHLWKVSPKKRCQWRWNFFRLCTPLLHSKRTDEERLAFKKRIHKINDHIENLSFNYPDNLLFISELEKFKFQKEHISQRDCFHPSVAGQDLLARFTWQKGWFAEKNLVTSN